MEADVSQERHVPCIPLYGISSWDNFHEKNSCGMSSYLVAGSLDLR